MLEVALIVLCRFSEGSKFFIIPSSLIHKESAHTSVHSLVRSQSVGLNQGVWHKNRRPPVLVRLDMAFTHELPN